jgi:hypothetical protein
MKFRFFALVAILIASGVAPVRVRAHAEDARLEISAERLNPGGTLELRGVDFEPEESVALTLSGQDVSVVLAPTVADVDGIFVYLVALPIDLAAGTYVVLAVSGDDSVSSPPFFVSGEPVPSEDDGGRREQAEPLLAPLAEFPQATPDPGSQSVPQAQDSTSRLTPVLAAAAVGFILLLALVVLGRQRIGRGH